MIRPYHLIVGTHGTYGGSDRFRVGEVPDAVKRSVLNIKYDSNIFPICRRSRFYDTVYRSRRALLHVDEEDVEEYINRMFTLGELSFDESAGLMHALLKGVRLNFRASDETEWTYNEDKKDASSYPEVAVASRDLAYVGYHTGCGYASEAVPIELPDYLLFENGNFERMLGARTDFNPQFEELVMRDVFKTRT